MPDAPYNKALHDVTRRHFFKQCGVGLGSVALNSMLGNESDADSNLRNMGIFNGQGQKPAKALNVIFMFMAGGPSQLELFDYKPVLQKYNNQIEDM